MTELAGDETEEFSVLFCFCKQALTVLASSGLEWTGEINPSVVLHITHIILIQPQQSPSETKIGLGGCDVVSPQGRRKCSDGTTSPRLVIDDDGSAFMLGPVRNRC